MSILRQDKKGESLDARIYFSLETTRRWLFLKRRCDTFFGSRDARRTPEKNEEENFHRKKSIYKQFCQIVNCDERARQAMTTRYWWSQIVDT